MAVRRSLAGIHGLTVVAVVAANGAAVAINAATNVSGRWPLGLESVRSHPFRWAVGFTVAVISVEIVRWWAERIVGRRSDLPTPAAEALEPWLIGRPTEVDRVVAGLRAGGLVGITTALHGEGGLGKTTVARLVGADPRVIRRFGGRVYWITMGRNVRTSGAIADRVNDLIRRVDPDRPVTFTDPLQAGAHLMTLLNSRPRRLLVVDDLWFPEQLAPFAGAGAWCALLVTTRVGSLIPENAVSVTVDQLSAAEARSLLIYGLQPLPRLAVDELLAQTGRWPLLLRLVNKVLVEQAGTGAVLATVVTDVVRRLRTSGALVIDELTDSNYHELDIDDPTKRRLAVRATIEASAGLLSIDERGRLAELAVFMRDESVPLELVDLLWQATAGFDQMATRRLCARLSDLALLTLTAGDDGGALAMHDVIRE